MRRFSRRARRYIYCYYVLVHNIHERDSVTGLNGDVKFKVKLEEIEKMVKLRIVGVLLILMAS
jgi:hypothetical protein